MSSNIYSQSNLSYKEYERYVKQIMIQEIKVEGQNRIKNAKIICIGAGGLNSSALIYLAACGVGEIGIIDNDTVELSNLQRQILYKHNDIDKEKVKVARKSLKSLNPLIKIKNYSEKLTQKNVERILSEYNLVIDGTDNFQARYLISQFCHKLHKVHIYGAIEKFTGQVSVFNYQNSIHYYNLHSHMSYSGLKTCSENGIINTLAGIIGLLQATEAIKITTGIGKVSDNLLTVFNLLNCSINKIKIKPAKLLNQKIFTHQTKNRPCSMQYVSIKSILHNKNQQYKLIDIRTPLEFKVNKINDSINIPLDTLKKKKSIKRMKELAKRYQIVVCCNNTTRSYLASQILYSHSINHYILDNSKSSKEREGFEPSLSNT